MKKWVYASHSMNMFVLRFGKVTHDINEKENAVECMMHISPVSQPFKKHCFATNSFCVWLLKK